MDLAFILTLTAGLERFIDALKPGLQQLSEYRYMPFSYPTLVRLAAGASGTAIAWFLKINLLTYVTGFDTLPPEVVARLEGVSLPVAYLVTGFGMSLGSATLELILDFITAKKDQAVMKASQLPPIVTGAPPE